MTGTYDQIIRHTPNEVSAEEKTASRLIGTELIGGTTAARIPAAPDLAPSLHLPNLELANLTNVSEKHTEKGHTPVASHPSFLTEVGNVLGEVGKGAADELFHHPDELLATANRAALDGLALGGLATLAIAAGVVSAPEIAIVGAAIAVAYLGNEALTAFENRDKIMHNADVVADPDAHSAKELKQARQYVENVGANAINQGVSLIAGASGGYTASIGVRYALSPAAAGATVVEYEDAPPVAKPNPKNLARYRNRQLAPRAAAIQGAGVPVFYSHGTSAGDRPGT